MKTSKITRRIIMDNSLYEEQQPLSWYERLKFLFIKPNKLFSNLKQHPKILFPTLTVFLGMIVLTLIRFNLFEEYIIINNEGLQDSSAISGTIVGTLLGLAIFPVLILIVKSGFIHGFVPLFGGDANYKQIFSIISYAYMPVMLGQVVIAIISLIIGEFYVSLSFAQFLPATVNEFYYVFLSQFDIFVIWYQVLAIIGASYLYEISKKKAAIPVLLTWISWLLIISSFQVIGNWIAQNMG